MILTNDIIEFCRTIFAIDNALVFLLFHDTNYNELNRMIRMKKLPTAARRWGALVERNNYSIGWMNVWVIPGTFMYLSMGVGPFEWMPNTAATELVTTVQS